MTRRTYPDGDGAGDEHAVAAREVGTTATSAKPAPRARRDRVGRLVRRQLAHEHPALVEPVGR